jgi:hypothetical protein
MRKKHSKKNRGPNPNTALGNEALCKTYTDADGHKVMEILPAAFGNTLEERVKSEDVNNELTVSAQ